jgi:hypothetical protein
MTGAVALRWRKWDGGQHYHSVCELLGEDDLGWWFGRRKGALYERPGRRFHGETTNVFLVPRVGQWIATFYPEGHPVEMLVYVDLAWDVRWDEANLAITAIDMDLDVVQVQGERGIWIDDVDEFAEHRLEYGYPDAVAEAVEQAAAEVEALVRTGSAPFDGRAEQWLRLLA